jgi:hypothetical protein
MNKINSMNKFSVGPPYKISPAFVKLFQRIKTGPRYLHMQDVLLGASNQLSGQIHWTSLRKSSSATQR